MAIFRIWAHVECANRWVTEFENEVTGLAREIGSICAYVYYDGS